jgi:hypothetical protein
MEAKTVRDTRKLNAVALTETNQLVGIVGSNDNILIIDLGQNTRENFNRWEKRKGCYYQPDIRLYQAADIMAEYENDFPHLPIDPDTGIIIKVLDILDTRIAEYSKNEMYGHKEALVHYKKEILEIAHTPSIDPKLLKIVFDELLRESYGIKEGLTGPLKGTHEATLHALDHLGNIIKILDILTGNTAKSN